jgi:hypothetical protein
VDRLPNSESAMLAARSRHDLLLLLLTVLKLGVHAAVTSGSCDARANRKTTSKKELAAVAAVSSAVVQSLPMLLAVRTDWNSEVSCLEQRTAHYPMYPAQQRDVAVMTMSFHYAADVLVVADLALTAVQY